VSRSSIPSGASRSAGSRAVTDGKAFLRLELALVVLALTATSLMLLVAMDAVEFHAAVLWHCATHLTLRHLEPHCVLLLALLTVDAVVIVRAVRSLMHQCTAHRAFVRALPVRTELVLEGHRVRVVPGRPLRAFCAGLMHPAVYVSEGTLREVSGPELRAVLAHEDHHRVRRDPLRTLLARVASDAFRPLPRLATIADRHAALADLAADAAAVRAVGGVQPLAAALVRFDEAGSGAAPERVDHLVRQGPPDSVPMWLLATACVTLAGIAALTVPMLLLGWHPEPLPVVLELAVLTAVCTPAYLAAWRVDACLIAPRPRTIV
jgi:Peptidase family M48